MNLMQYLSVSGALESPRERKNSRRIGYNDSDSFNSKPISLTEVSRVNNNQGEFGFIEPLEIDRHSQSPGNHLGLSKEESKAQSIESGPGLRRSYQPVVGLEGVPSEASDKVVKQPLRSTT